jgi:hypothetical protein
VKALEEAERSMIAATEYMEWGWVIFWQVMDEMMGGQQ